MDRQGRRFAGAGMLGTLRIPVSVLVLAILAAALAVCFLFGPGFLRRESPHQAPPDRSAEEPLPQDRSVAFSVPQQQTPPVALTDEQKAHWADLSGAMVKDAEGKFALQYDVTTADVVLALEKDSTDLRATEDLTYNVWGGKKSAGSQAVGGSAVTDYTCSDGEGHEFPTYIDGEGSKKATLVWFFPEVTNGTQRSVAQFTLQKGVKRDGDLTVVTTPWVGSWLPDVQRLRWTVAMPVGEEPDVRSVLPAFVSCTKVFHDGRWTVTQEQSPLKKGALQLSFVARDMTGPGPAEGTTEEVAMPEASFLSGTVVDVATGKPAPGVSVGCGTSTPSGDFWTYNWVVSDGEGRFQTAPLAPGSVVSIGFGISPTGKYLLDEEWMRQGRNGEPISKKLVTQSETDLVLKVRLAPVIPLAGRVTDSQGQPVAGAQVWMQPNNSIAADQEGRFTLAVGRADRDYDLFAMSPQMDLAGIVRLKAGTSTATIALEPTRTYTGEVTDEDGRPAAGLSFRLNLVLDGTDAMRVQQRLVTDEAGRFTVEHLCPKAAYYAFWRPDNEMNQVYGDSSAPVDVPAVAEGQPIRFTAKMYVNVLKGRVVNEKMEPVPGAQIVPGDDLGGLDLMSVADRRTPQPLVASLDGGFRFERLAAGALPFRVSAPGYRTKKFKARTNDADFVAVLAPPTSAGATFAVTVRDEQGRSVPDAPVELRTQHNGSPVATAAMTGRTNAAGQAKLVFAGSGQERRDEALIVCDVPGYNLAYCPVNLDEDLDAAVRLEKAGEAWHGRVTDAQGQPVAGATVTVLSVQDAAGSLAHVSGPTGLPCDFPCDEAGAFVLDRLSAKAQLDVRVKARGYADAQIRLWPGRTGSQGQTVVLRFPATIRGRLVAEGGAELPGEWMVWASVIGNGSAPASVMAAPDKTFQMQSVQQGTYVLNARSEDAAASKWVASLQPAMKVRAGETTTTTIVIAPAIEVHGRFARPAGEAAGQRKPREVTALSVSADRVPSATQFNAYADAEGGWTLYLPEGTFRLLQSDGSGWDSETGRNIVVTKGKPLDEIVIEAK